MTRNKSCFLSIVSNPSSFAAAEQAVYSCIAHKSGERLRKDFWGKYDSFRGQKILLHKFLLSPFISEKGGAASLSCCCLFTSKRKSTMLSCSICFAQVNIVMLCVVTRRNTITVVEYWCLLKKYQLVSLFYLLEVIFVDIWFWKCRCFRTEPHCNYSITSMLKWCHLRKKLKCMSCENLPVESGNVLLKYTACIHLYLFPFTVLQKTSLQGFLSC